MQQMNATPEISVVTSVYNGGDALEETLRSVLDQSGCDLEYVVVDDGSTDNTSQRLDQWAAGDPRLRVIHQNTGLTRALITGCNAARAALIARQDVGDLSLPRRFAAQAAFLQSHPGVAFVGCRHELVGPRGESLSPLDADESAKFEAPRTRDGLKLPCPHHGTVMFRKSAYLKAGGYRPEFYFAQDADLWSRLIDQGGFDCVAQVLYQVKFDMASITARHRDAQERLRSLVTEATSRRRRGESEADVLRIAAGIRPERSPGTAASDGRRARAAAAYFVASCLAKRRDPRARGYLLDALRQQPLNPRAWYKLLLVSLRP
jgi:glycosyltransferase involved in cell wall biosynthesis